MVQDAIRRIVFISALGAMALLICGCASYQRAPVSAEAVPGVLTEGTSVRVVMLSGDKFTGRVVGNTAEEITLDGLGNYGETDIVLRTADVDYVEFRRQSDHDIEQGWFIMLGVAVVTAVFLSSWGMN